ncbi:MAG: leucine-rich repeat domain-containing protein, partial [Candidatus Ventricola sp.]
SVALSAWLESIGINSFLNCSQLTEVILPASLSWITFKDGFLVTNGNSVISYLSPGSREAIVREGIEEVWDSAFMGCTALEEVALPGSVTSIADDAFNGCTALRQVSIPSSVTEIGSQVFKNCPSGLTLLVFPGSYAEQWAKDNGIQYKTY